MLNDLGHGRTYANPYIFVLGFAGNVMAMISTLFGGTLSASGPYGRIE